MGQEPLASLGLHGPLGEDQASPGTDPGPWRGLFGLSRHGAGALGLSAGVYLAWIAGPWSPTAAATIAGVLSIGVALTMLAPAVAISVAASLGVAFAAELAALAATPSAVERTPEAVIGIPVAWGVFAGWVCWDWWRSVPRDVESESIQTERMRTLPLLVSVLLTSATTFNGVSKAWAGESMPEVLGKTMAVAPDLQSGIEKVLDVYAEIRWYVWLPVLFIVTLVAVVASLAETNKEVASSRKIRRDAERAYWAGLESVHTWNAARRMSRETAWQAELTKIVNRLRMSLYSLSLAIQHAPRICGAIARDVLHTALHNFQSGGKLLARAATGMPASAVAGMATFVGVAGLIAGVADSHVTQWGFGVVPFLSLLVGLAGLAFVFYWQQAESIEESSQPEDADRPEPWIRWLIVSVAVLPVGIASGLIAVALTRKLGGGPSPSGSLLSPALGLAGVAELCVLVGLAAASLRQSWIRNR